MEIITFNTILTKMCNDFDELISPKTITRANTNIIYLIFKAIAKGYEIINNACVAVSNKFDPARCEPEDLESVAKLVGTERLKGSGSGLHIIVTNNADTAVDLLPGEYTYELDATTKFIFEVAQTVTISAGGNQTFIAMTENYGSYHVTAQQDIEVTSLQDISDDLSFSCTDNSSLLGVEPESDIAFRERILNSTDTQDSIVELETQLRNLPYLFDCRIKFNNTTSPVTYDGIAVPPFNALIFYSGSPKQEIAEIIANKIICPTVQTQDSVTVAYQNEVFITGEQVYYLTPFSRYMFDIDITIKVDNTYISSYEAKASIRSAVTNAFTFEVHQDYVREDDIYNIIESLNLSGITLLSVNLRYNGANVDYIEVPISKIPGVNSVNIGEV